jgi:hypothetical protein
MEVTLSLENLDILEARISGLIDRLNAIINEKDALSDRVGALSDTLEKKEAEIVELKETLKEIAVLEEKNRQFIAERAEVKKKTLTILGRLEQLEVLFDQPQGVRKQDHSENNRHKIVKDDRQGLLFQEEELQIDAPAGDPEE